MTTDLLHPQSLRQLVERGRGEDVDRALAQYHPILARTFPLAGEIESAEAYREYLLDPELEWDVVVLRNGAQEVVGGIQWQALRAFREASPRDIAWVEHVWLVQSPQVRRFGPFLQLLRILRQQMATRGVVWGFLEFNDPEKMTAEEIRTDTSSGISPEQRVRLWARMGVFELGHSVGETWEKAPYAQPRMGAGPPVTYSSIGFFSFGPELELATLDTEDYVSVLHLAHRTIDDVDPQVDPTCRHYTTAIRSLTTSTLRFRALRERFGSASSPEP